MEIEIKGLEGLNDAACIFVEQMKRGKVYAFYGEMGAGKTTFISEICNVLGVGDDVSSPTFSIVNEYDMKDGAKIYHFDCYRLETEEEGLAIGADDYFTSGETCFIEWPERIAGILPEDTVEVEILVEDTGIRRVRING